MSSYEDLEKAPNATGEIEEDAMVYFEDMYPETVIVAKPEEYRELNFED